MLGCGVSGSSTSRTAGRSRSGSGNASSGRATCGSWSTSRRGTRSSSSSSAERTSGSAWKRRCQIPAVSAFVNATIDIPM
jgi:hypothetical protein